MEMRNSFTWLTSEALIIVVLCCMLLISLYRNTVYQDDLSDANALLSYKERELLTWQDDLHQARAQTTALQASEQAMKAHYGNVQDSLEKSLQLSLKRLKSHTSMTLQHQGHIKASVRVLDSLSLDSMISTLPMLQQDVAGLPTALSAQAFSYQDKWLTVTGLITGKQSGTDIDLLYSSRDSLDIVTYLKRPGLRFWKPAVFKVDAVSYNPHSSFTGLSHRQVKIREKRFGIGPFIGVSLTGKIQVGGSLHYSFIQF